jgi:hypothetical protein
MASGLIDCRCLSLDVFFSPPGWLFLSCHSPSRFGWNLTARPVFGGVISTKVMGFRRREYRKQRRSLMVITDWVHVIAGVFILLSLAMGTWVNPYWYLFTAFVGANLFQYGITKFCPMALILKRLGVPETR